MITLYYFVFTMVNSYDYIAIMKRKFKRPLKVRNVIFRMIDDEVKRLDLVATREDRSRAQVLRRLVADGLDRVIPLKGWPMPDELSRSTFL